MVYSARDIAIEYVRSLIQRLLREGTYRLPGVRKLAKEAGCSITTMNRAVKQLADEGKLRIISKTGIYLEGFAAKNDERVNNTLRWEKVRDAILEDFLSGRSVHQERIAVLQNRYGVSYLTLKNALASIDNDKDFRSLSMPYMQKGSSLCLILWGNYSRFPILDHHRSTDFIRSFEFACRNRGFSLQVIIGDTNALQKENRVILYSRNGEEIRDHGFFGIFFGCVVYGSLHSALIPFIRATASLTLPVAVVSEWNDQSFFEQIKQIPGVYFLQIALSADPGFAVSKYLYECGHRKIAYISPFFGAIWAKERYNGICKFQSCPGVNLYVVNFPDDLPDTFEKIPMEYPDDTLFESLRGYFSRAGIASQSGLLEVYAQSRKEIHTIAVREIFNIHIERLLDRAINDGISAIIADCDRTALGVLAVLKKRCIQVPSAISVIGFDDSPEAVFHNLTSYNFNLPCAIEKILMYFHSPHVWRFSRQKGWNAIEGFVIPRGSTCTRCDL